MIRNIKTLGLALVAVFALSVVAASAAQAEGMDFTAGSYPVTLSGGQTTKHVFTVQGNKVECENASFPGSGAEQSNMVTVAPSYSNCTAFGFVGATVEMNGCEYTFTLEGTDPKETGNPDKGVGSVDIVCPTGAEITVVAATCTVHIPAQSTVAGGLTFEAITATGKINVIANVTGITSKVTSGFLCPLTAKATDTSGKYTGTTEESGSSALGMVMT